MRIEFVTKPEQIHAGDALQVLLPGRTPCDESHFAMCKSAVEKTGATLITAPFIKDNRIVMAYLEGEICVLQSACFLLDDAVGLASGDDIDVFETRLGKIAMAAGYDALQPQYARLAALRGCQIMIAALFAEGEDYLMCGPWSAAQANCLAVAAAQPEGGCLILPCELTENLSGFGRDSFETEELKRAYAGFPVFDCMNIALFERYGEVLSL